MTNRLSIRAVSLGEDLRQIAPVAQALGFRGLQLDMSVGQLNLTELSLSGRREVRHLISDSNLELESLRGALPADLLMNAREHDRVLWMMKRAVDATVGMSIGICCIDSGRLPQVRKEKPRATSAPQPASSLIIIPETSSLQAEPEPEVDPAETAAWSGIDNIMREIGSLADRAGVILAFTSELSSFASLSRLLGGAQCPWFAVDLDPVSVLRDRWDLEHILDSIGGSLRHVRARDAVRGSGGRTQSAAIGQGSTDWGQMVGMLDAGAYSGWITVDTVGLTDRVAAARNASSYLLSLRP